MSLTFFVRGLLLNPVILGGIFLVLTPLVVWRVHRFLASGAGIGATLDLLQRLAGILVAVSLLAGVLTAIAGRWGTPLGDQFRLRALQRTAVASQSPPGVRLLSERSHVSSYAGIDEYTAGEKDPPDTSSYERTFRVEADLPDVASGFEWLASRTGWKLVSAECGPSVLGSSRERQRNARLYERRISGFRATLGIAYFTLPSTVFPETFISDIEVRLRAPSVLAGEPERTYRIDQACLTPPSPAPRPPAPAGACDAASRKLGTVLSEAAAPLVARPLRMSNIPADLRRMQVRPSDEDILASDPPSEPRALLEEHGALDGYKAYDRISGKNGRPGRRESTYAYQFPSHDAAVAFHHDVVARACAQAIDAFDVPVVEDAVGLRLYLPATGPECLKRWDLQWGLAFASASGPGCGDWLIEYVAFVRGHYHVSVAVGGPERERLDPASVHDAALKVGAAAARRSCEVRAGSGVARNCR